MPQFASGSFTAVGNGAAVGVQGAFNVHLWGTFTATVIVERSIDGGATWLPLSWDAFGTPNAYSAPVSLIVEEPGGGMLHRLRCSSYTSGAVNWAIGI
jgi:hypothetical protein